MVSDDHESGSRMSGKNRPKYSFSKKIDQGEFLNVAVWPGRSKPEDEVVSIQFRKFDGSWKTISRLALYRTKEGTYSELPEKADSPRQEKGDASQ